MLFILGICSGESTKGFFRGKIRGVCRRGLAVCVKNIAQRIFYTVRFIFRLFSGV